MATTLALALNIFHISKAVISHAVEICPVYKFESVFEGEYYKDYLWVNNSGARKVSWSLQNSTIELKGIASSKPRLVSRKFTESERAIVRKAFKNWDDASEKLNFEEVSETAAPDIKVGLTSRTPADDFTTYLWNFGYTTGGGQNSPYNMIAGTIILADDNQSLSNEVYLLNLMQNALGRLIGLGNVSNSFNGESVMKWPISSSKPQSPLGDLDIGLLRQRYGESTCPESFPWIIKEQRARTAAEKTVADAERRASEILARANSDASRITSDANTEATRLRNDAKSEASRILQDANNQREAILGEANRILTSAQDSTKTTTLRCSKGATKFNVTAIAPKCPKGFTAIKIST